MSISISTVSPASPCSPGLAFDQSDCFHWDTGNGVGVPNECDAFSTCYDYDYDYARGRRWGWRVLGCVHLDNGGSEGDVSGGVELERSVSYFSPVLVGLGSGSVNQ